MADLPPLTGPHQDHGLRTDAVHVPVAEAAARAELARVNGDVVEYHHCITHELAPDCGRKRDISTQMPTAILLLRLAAGRPRRSPRRRVTARARRLNRPGPERP